TEAAALVVQPLVALMVDDRSYLVRSAGATDPGYFRLWALEAVAGTLFGAAEMAQGAPVAVISEAAARQLFGSGRLSRRGGLPVPVRRPRDSRSPATQNHRSYGLVDRTAR